MQAVRARVAIFPWGNVIEDYLAGIGISLEEFATEMTGGWLYGYVEALRRVGVSAVVICTSEKVEEPTRFTHNQTGTTVWALPAPAAYLAIRRRTVDPTGWTVDDAFGPSRGLLKFARHVIHDVAPYLAVPVRSVRGILEREMCTAIICQEHETPRFDLLARMSRRLGLPLYSSFQGGDAHISRLERFIRPVTLRWASGIICAASTEAERIASRYGYPAERIHAIPNPLDLAAWRLPDRQMARRKLGIPAQATVVSWHGRVAMTIKGLDVLLEAWRVVQARFPDRDIRLVMVGTGTDRDLLRTRLAEPGYDAVHWVDEYVIDRDRLRCHLATSDLHVFPSRHEGSPVALMEAMAAGLPVVAAAAPGVSDILGPDRAGVLVPTGDAAALAGGLIQLIDDEALREALGERARIRAEEAFSMDAVGARLREAIGA